MGARVSAGIASVLCVAAAGCGGGSTPDTNPHHSTRVVAGRDSEGNLAFAVSASAVADTKRAAAPSAVRVSRQPAPAGETQPSISPGAPSDAEVRRDLKALKAINAAQHSRQKATTSGRAAGLTRGGNAPISADLPEAVARVVAGANAIARYPYVYGGGHRSFVDTAYDCSGSVSYALAAGGFLHQPLDSGQLARAGAPGPGRYITIYANAGHVFMEVAGLRFDTSGRDGPRGSRWQKAPRSEAHFRVRHPPGF